MIYWYYISMSIILLIIDGFGIGEMPDAKNYSDIGADTYRAIQEGIRLPNLIRLGLNNIFGVSAESIAAPLGCYARMREFSPAKDTLTGHHEIAGVITYERPMTYPNGFPQCIVDKLELAFGCKILGNEVASGTEIINRLGDEHMGTKCPIIYTSADSVLQIACHEDIIPIEQLYSYCNYAINIMQGNYTVQRVIARPFVGKEGNYTRTENRKDFCIPPQCETMMERLSDMGIGTVAIGKISDIFCGKGFCEQIEAHNNTSASNAVLNAMKKNNDNCMIFANFVDTDMLYGHRRDIDGYRRCMEDVDLTIGEVMNRMKDDDVIIVTSDHGCDPSYIASTDHTREYVPLMIYGESLKHNVNLNTVHGFDSVAQTILDYYGIMSLPKSLMPLISKKTRKSLIKTKLLRSNN